MSDLFGQEPASGAPRLRNDPMCEACNRWGSDPRTGLFFANCEQCTGRAIAQGPAAWDAVRNNSTAALLTLIDRVWGPEHRKRGRAVVWEWIKRLNLVAKPG